MRALRLAAALAVLGGALAVPSAAGAVAFAELRGDVVEYAGGSEANALSFSQSGNTITFSDAGATSIVTDSDCSTGSGGSVTCTSPDSSFEIWVGLGAGNDTAVAASSVTAPTVWNPLLGSESGLGNDAYAGSSGVDTFFAEPGADRYNGNGASGDTITYQREVFDGGVSVTLDGAADDGLPGEGDDVETDVENVVGSEGDDTIEGSGSGNILSGNLGADTLEGGPGSDSLYGERQADCAGSLPDFADVLDGEAGDDDHFGCGGGDTLVAGPGFDLYDGGQSELDLLTFAGRGTAVEADLSGGEDEDEDVVGVERLRGGSGADELSGDGGENVIEGGPGNDLLRGLANQDLLRGDAGSDSLNGGPDPDELHGGADSDNTLEYAGAAVEVRVSLDGVGNDGPIGVAGGDNVHPDIEIVSGGLAGDVLVGSAGDEVLIGQGGDDLLEGGAGSDSLGGLAGDDELVGGAGADSLQGGDDEDTLRARDATVDTTLDCGAGADSALLDPSDPATVGCELEDRMAPRATPSVGSHAFGGVPVGSRSATFAFTVTNTGESTLTLGALALGGPDASHFALSADTCSGASLPPDASCSFEAGFAPAAPGPRSATVTIPSNDPDGPATVLLSGTGASPGGGSGGSAGSSGGAAPGGGASHAAGLADNEVVGVRVRAKRRQPQGKAERGKIVVRLKAGAAERVRIVAAGKIVVGKGAGAARPASYRLARSARKARAGKLLVFALRPRGGAAAKVADALLRGGKAVAIVRLAFADEAGARAKRKLRIKLPPAPSGPARR